MTCNLRTSLTLLVPFLWLLIGCQSTPKPETDDEKPTSQVADEVSLKSDRSQFEEMRKDIPETVKRENDELAFIRGLMGEGDEEPGKIRDRFSKAIRDRRDKFDKTTRHRREDFNRREKKEREDFLKKLKEERDHFMQDSKNMKSDKRKEFFDEQEAQRNDFFGDQRDHRKDFESQETEDRKNFEAYVTEKRSQFDHEIKDYSATYYERRKNLDLKKRGEEKAKAKAKREAESEHRSDAPASSGGVKRDTYGADPDLEDFNSIPKNPGTHLGTPGE